MSAKTIMNEKDSDVMKNEGASLSRVRYLTMTGLMAALITIMTAYICHIPVGVNGGYIHFGDSLIYLAAVLLPRPYALAAAAIGGANGRKRDHLASSAADPAAAAGIALFWPHRHSGSW